MPEYSKHQFWKNIRRRLERLPMLRALVPFVVGVIIADVVTLPLWGVAIGFVVCSVMAAARY
ncbi:MAG: hypothetical protein IIU59_05735, partial [Alistipes sp.]|nr:hypothetical protein [Alistipes sp.]